MNVKRRQLLGMSALVLPLFFTIGTSSAKGVEILGVEGIVTAKNYRGLEAFLFNSVDKLIRLKISFTPNKDAQPETVAAYEEGELFIAYLRSQPLESQISVSSGENLQNGFHVVDGFFTVKNAGMQQGITALVLEKSDSGAVLAANPTVKNIPIDQLKAEIRD